jgi:hypothetical protein
MFQNTLTKVDTSASTKEAETSDASTMTADLTRVDECVSTIEGQCDIDCGFHNRLCYLYTDRDQVCYDYQSVSED